MRCDVYLRLTRHNTSIRISNALAVTRFSSMTIFSISRIDAKQAGNHIYPFSFVDRHDEANVIYKGNKSLAMILFASIVNNKSM